MKILGGIVPFDMKRSSINLPDFVRLALGVQPGIPVYFGLVKPHESAKSDRKPKSQLIITGFQPTAWGDLWRMDLALQEGFGRVHSVVKFLHKNEITILVEESLTTKLDATHEMTIVADLRNYAADADLDSDQRKKTPDFNLTSLPTKMEEDLKGMLRDNKLKIREAISISRMNFLYWASKYLYTSHDKKAIPENPDELVWPVGRKGAERGRVTVPWTLMKIMIEEIKKERNDKDPDIKIEKVIVFCDTEERYASLLPLLPGDDVYWLDIIHPEGERYTIEITDYFQETEMNILCSFHQIEHLSNRTHFYVFLDMTNLPEAKDDKLPMIKKDLRMVTSGSLIDVSELEYQIETGWYSRKEPPIEIREELYTTYDKMKEIEGLFKTLSKFDRSQYSVIGSCVHYNDDHKNSLREIAKTIQGIFAAKNWRDRNNFLIAGAPATGKSFFVKELGKGIEKRMGREFDFYKPISLNAIDEKALQGHIKKLERLSRRRMVLAFVDEIDSKEKEPWPLEMLLPCMDWGWDRGLSIVWVFAGSVPGGIKSFEEKITSRNKGPDFWSRLSPQRIYLQGLKVSDKVIITLNTVKDRTPRIKQVEKKALGHAALNFFDPREIEYEVFKAVTRAGSTTTLKYENFFEPKKHPDDVYSRFLERVSRKLPTKTISL